MNPDLRSAGTIRAIIVCFFGIWLGFPNDLFSLPPLVFLWPLSLTWLGLHSRRPGKAFYNGWLASVSGAFAALYWLCLPVHQVGGLPLPLAICCAILIAACLALQGGFYACGIFFLAGSPPWKLAVMASLLWYLLEYAFAVVAGFPWLPLSGALAVWPLLVQPANLVGAWCTGSLWLCALLLCAPAGAGSTFEKRHVAGAALLVMMAAYGLWRLGDNPPETLFPEKKSVSAIFVEGNVEQNQKWLPQFQRQTLDLYINLTSRALQDSSAHGFRNPLIIWPETALPFFFENRPQLAERLRDAVRLWGCPLLFGAPGVETWQGGAGDAIYNRAFLLGPNGAVLGYYDKTHLVPFGEYAPEWINFDFLKELLQGVGIYHEGKSSQPLIFEQLALGMLICYEGIFPWLAQERVAAGANILVDISNDGWFGRTPAGRQHLYLTVPRCVEQNRWLLRATNTGISAVVDNFGRVITAGPQFQTGYVEARARLSADASLYHYLANWLPLLAMVLLSALAAGEILKKLK